MNVALNNNLGCCVYGSFCLVFPFAFSGNNMLKVLFEPFRHVIDIDKPAIFFLAVSSSPVLCER